MNLTVLYVPYLLGRGALIQNLNLTVLYLPYSLDSRALSNEVMPVDDAGALRVGIGFLGLVVLRSRLGNQVTPRKVDIRLPGKGDSNSHGARPVHQIISMIKWIRTGRLSMKDSLFCTSFAFCFASSTCDDLDRQGCQS